MILICRPKLLQAALIISCALLILSSIILVSRIVLYAFLSRKPVLRIHELVYFRNELPGLFSLFLIDERDSEAGMDQYQIAQFGLRQQRSLGLEAIAHRVDNRLISIQFYYSCRYRQ